MNRSEAIDEIIAYVDRIEGEWGSGGSTDREVIEVLTALGVTHDELVAHNVVREGYWYRTFISIADRVAAGAPYEEIAHEIAITLDSRRSKEGEFRNQIFNGIEKGWYAG
ncbi:hypothetical protein ACFYU5_18820 [Nocardia aobensis]|uniref:Uncharacterized protein n=1 Tax=Nocardia aobensis TaxID=257277 RepID=A0ABW6P5N9_9NOCA